MTRSSYGPYAKARGAEFRRGVLAAAAVADDYNGSTTHPYRLGDCIACKLNATARQKPRTNKRALKPTSYWICGMVTALAEIHRQLVGGNDSKGICAVARSAGITLAVARAAGAPGYDVRELKRAGVP